MGKILDFIVGNTFVFIGVIIALLATLLAVILSVKKSLKKRKIPIYEEIDENIELESAKEEDIIEKPTKRSKKIEAKEDKVEKKSKKVEEKKEDKESKKEKAKKKVSEEEVIIVADKEEIKEEKTDKKIKDIKKELESIFEEEPEVLEVIDEPEEIVEVEEEFNDDESALELEMEFDDEALREELEKIDDKEIEERIDEEHKKDIEDEIKDNDNDELKEILEGMKDTNEVDPEEVVRNFEEEQEAQSIISYQELLSVVKKRDAEFEDELESRPLTTVSDFIKNEKTSDIEPEANVLEMIEKIDRPKKEVDEEDIEELEQIDEKLEELEVLSSESDEEMEEREEVIVEKEPLPEIPDEGRFKKTDVISPVFGRIDADKEIDYPKVEKFDRSHKKSDIIVERSVNKPAEVNENIRKEKIAKEMQSVSAMFEDISSALVEKEKKEEHERNAGKRQLEDENIESLSAISKNEDFLKALKDFRDSL